jgi:hypothetical protein
MPTATAWYIGVAGQQLGPLDAAGLQSNIANGQLTGSTLVWRAGMAAWSAASTVPEIAALLPQAPPPLPQG